jgi:ribonuclease III
MQAEHKLTPSYRIVREEGPDHAKRFTAQVVVEGNVWGEGDGSTKQGAEQAAADAALRSYGELRFGGATSAQSAR